MDTPIIHVDMDAFFAAVEIRDNPALQGKPVIIGGDPRTDVRGVVATACYRAREYGVRSAMPLVQAWRLCPQGVFLRGNGKKYARVSAQAMAIFSRYTPLVEPISIDEAFLDVTGCERLFGDAATIASAIQRDVARELQLSCSVGVAPNKFLAKLASDLKKPGGLTVIRPGEVEQVLHPLPVEKLWGVGEKTARKLRDMGIETVGQLARLSKPLLTAGFGRLGENLWYLARGEDTRSVVPRQECKSLSRETTFRRDSADSVALKAVMLELAEDVAWRLREQGLVANTVSIKVRFGNFETKTRQGHLAAGTCLAGPIYTKAVELLGRVQLAGRGVRLVGVGVSGLEPAGQGVQLSFFTAGPDREQRIAEAADKIARKYGREALRRGAVLMLDQQDQ